MKKLSCQSDVVLASHKGADSPRASRRAAEDVCAGCGKLFSADPPLTSYVFMIDPDTNLNFRMHLTVPCIDAAKKRLPRLGE